MMPTRQEWDELYDTLRPHAAERIALHFAGTPNANAPLSRRQSEAGMNVVWIGGVYERSDKSLIQAAKRAIKKSGETQC